MIFQITEDGVELRLWKAFAHLLVVIDRHHLVDTMITDHHMIGK